MKWAKLAMPDEMMKFLTLDRWGRRQSWQMVEMYGDENLSLGNGDELELDVSRKNGEGGRRDDDIAEDLVPVGITNRN